VPALELTAAAIAHEVAARLQSDAPRLREQWRSSRPVRHFIVDDVLPPDEVEEVFRNVPPRERLTHKKSLRESKWVGVDVDHYHPAIGAHLFAFQEPEVVRAVAAITGIDDMVADPSLYASGISLMAKGDFLNPHLDNSHDGDQRNYRVLNLLFYVTPHWTLQNGGNLELWTSALDQPVVVESRFNRLVVMATSDQSWHSVQPVVACGARVCLSNYYFAPEPAADHAYRNVTSFRGRPGEPVKKVLLRADSAILNFIGKLMPSLLRRNPHRRQ
jgi:Rps23 Pro-64 3,4-dihydroxylase Tpa1-like proline 4-hydroxylase